MSNVSIFQSAVIPDYLRNQELDDSTKSFINNTSGKRISLKGCVFRMMVDGKQQSHSDDRFMNLVVIASATNTSRTFYEAGYEEGSDPVPPTCSSFDGVHPDKEVKTPQSSNCATCSKNIAGTGTNGKGRACRYSRTMAVALANDLHGDVYKLTIPATSIFGKPENHYYPFDAYGQHCASHGVNMNSVVTEMRFDTSVSTPKVFFKAVGYLQPADIALMKERAKTPEVQAIVKHSHTSAPAPALISHHVAQTAQTEATSTDEPVLVTKQKPATPVPSSATKMLEQWED